MSLSELRRAGTPWVPSAQRVLEKQGISIQPLQAWTHWTKLSCKSRALSLTRGGTAPGSRICCSCWYTCYSRDSYQYPLFYLQIVRRAKCYPPVNTSAFTWIWLDLLMFGRFLKTPPLAADQPYCPLEGLPSWSLAAAEAHDSLLLFLKQPARFPLAHLHFSILDFSAISLSKESWVSVVLCVCDSVSKQ